MSAMIAADFPSARRNFGRDVVTVLRLSTTSATATSKPFSASASAMARPMPRRATGDECRLCHSESSIFASVSGVQITRRMVLMLKSSRASSAVLAHQVALEHDRAGEAVGEIIIADGGNGDVDLHGVEVLAEQPAPWRPAPAGSCMRPTKGRLISCMRCGVLDVPRLVQVLAVDQRDEFRIVEIISPGEARSGA